MKAAAASLLFLAVANSAIIEVKKDNYLDFSRNIVNNHAQ